MSTQDILCIGNKSNVEIKVKALQTLSSTSYTLKQDKLINLYEATGVDGVTKNIGMFPVESDPPSALVLLIKYSDEDNDIISLSLLIGENIRVKNGLNTSKRNITKTIAGMSDTTINYDKCEVILLNGQITQRLVDQVFYSVVISIDGDDFETITIEGVHCAGD